MIRNKHLIRLSFLGIFLSVIGNMIFYRYFMIEDFILKQAIDDSAYIASMYKDSVWDQNKEITFKLKDYPYQELIDDPNFMKLTTDSLAFFNSIKAQKILIYDRFGNPFLSSNTLRIIGSDDYDSSNISFEHFQNYLDKFFLKTYQEDKGLDLAYKGQSSYYILLNGSIYNFNFKSFKGHFINSYIPIISHGLDGIQINAVLKITYNVTDIWKNMNFLEQKVIMFFTLIFFVFFFIIMYNTHYAQKVIDEQLETQKHLREARKKAESENVAKSRFLANISHELRTPLNSIIGFSEIMLSGSYGEIGSRQYYGYVQDIYNSGKHLLAVINDILDFTKASADKLKIDNIDIDLNKLVSSSLRFIKTKAEEAGICLIEKLPKERVVINADPKRLKQALLNLLSNSVKFTPSNGYVTLEVEVDKQKSLVYIRVIDTGIGIADKDIPQALSSFGQVDSKASREYEGTGLGLPLTSKLIDLMKGTLEIVSKPGSGTTVIITFNYDPDIQV